MATTATASGPVGSLPVGLIISGIGTIAAIGFVIMQLNTLGHGAYNTSNAGMFWGFPIVVYDFLMMLSLGCTLVAGLSLVLGMEEFSGIARRCLWLALATLIGGVGVLFLELGYPLRALTAAPVNLATSSPLFWKILLVAAYGIVLLILCLKDRPSGGPLALLAGILAVFIALVAGSVYGLMSMRPMWFGAGTIVGFLIQAGVGGLAAAMLVTRLSGDNRSDGLLGGTLARLLVITLLLHFALAGGRVLSGLYGNQEGLQAWQHIVATPMFHIGFWGGILVPIVILAVPASRSSAAMQTLATALVLVGLLIHHYEFIIGGQLVPMFKGSWVRGLVSYSPSITEWALLGVGVFLSWLVYAIGGWRFGTERE